MKSTVGLENTIKQIISLVFFVVEQNQQFINPTHTSRQSCYARNETKMFKRN